jgi:RHS repeat-associated protein
MRPPRDEDVGVVEQALDYPDGSTEAPTIRFVYSDILGSIDTVADDHANILGVRDYSPFGVNRRPPANDGVPYGFTGQEHDEDFGLINMHGRMYDPVLGQFTSADPVVQDPAGQGLNRFAYVNNSPLTFTDPSGFTISGEEENRIVGWSALGVGWGAIGYGFASGAFDAASGSAAAVAGSVAFEGSTAIVGDATEAGVAEVAGSGDPLALLAPISQAPGALASVDRLASGRPNPGTGVASKPKVTNGTHSPKGDGASPKGPSGPQEAAPRRCNDDVGCPVQEGAPKLDRPMARGPGASPSLAKEPGGGPPGFDEAMEDIRGGHIMIAPALGELFEGVASAWRWLFPAARAGVPLSRTIEAGLVNPGGKLAQVLGGIEKGYSAAGPKTALDALKVVKNATTAAGLDTGVATVGKTGEIVLQNVGGVSTTLGTNGSILVQRGADVLLHLLP